MSTINTNQPLISNSLTSFWNVESEDTSSASENKAASALETAKKSTKTVQQAYGMPQLDMLASAAQAAYKGLGLNGSDRVTFSTINEYKEQQRTDFSKKAEEALSELGVDKDVEYQVVTSYSGEGVDIITDSPDKSKIEQAFRDNPELVEQFKEIQYLDNLEATRSRESINANLAVSRIQLQAMSGLFNTNPSSSIMSYGQGGSYFGMGLSTIV